MENNFPLEELKAEDYGPIQLFGFKDYYKNSFSELLENVRNILFNKYHN